MCNLFASRGISVFSLIRRTLNRKSVGVGGSVSYEVSRVHMIRETDETL